MAYFFRKHMKTKPFGWGFVFRSLARFKKRSKLDDGWDQELTGLPLKEALGSDPIAFFYNGEKMHNNKRLRDVIDKLDYYELLRIKKDLKEGGKHLVDFIDAEITKRNVHHHVYCAVCGTEIIPSSTDTSTLVFGPADFRKKATFCGKDCLNYFIKTMDERKQSPVVTHE